MVLETITDLRGLGFKDWTKYKLDPSDEDGGTYKSKTDIYMYMSNSMMLKTTT